MNEIFITKITRPHEAMEILIMVLLQGLCYVVDITMVFLTFIGINLTLLYFSFIITLTTGNRAALILMIQS